MLDHGSLFSGIGGFDEGAKRAGIDTKWTCEIEKFQRIVLMRRYGVHEQFEDIRTCNPGPVGILSAGFPCQDISIAGSMVGISGERSGLWSEVARIVGDIRPRYVLLENVPGLVLRGLDQVLCDLARIGYDAEWQCISNGSFGYPHRRKRIYIIAYPSSERGEGDVRKDERAESIFRSWAPNWADAYAMSARIQEKPTVSDIRNGPRLLDWTHRVAALGNAVNATVAHYLFHCIKLDYERDRRPG